jgi:hypothetical protein
MTDRPTIFLDLDDVLTTMFQYNQKQQKWDKEYNRYHFDAKCVKVFNFIIEKTNPIIILSSDWKLKYSIEQMNRIFEINGVKAVVTDYTPNLWGTVYKSMQQLEECRSEEILKYVVDNANIVDKWVAIDDLNLFPWIPDNFVRCTHVTEGIKQSGVKDKILKILI